MTDPEKHDSSTPSAEQPPSKEGFEEFVAAALRVDPKGLSGKHRREDQSQEQRGQQLDHRSASEAPPS